jgi:hypothetical protein
MMIRATTENIRAMRHDEGENDTRIPTTMPFITLGDISFLFLSPMMARMVRGSAEEGTIKAKRKQTRKDLILMEYERG